MVTADRRGRFLQQHRRVLQYGLERLNKAPQGKVSFGASGTGEVSEGVTCLALHPFHPNPPCPQHDAHICQRCSLGRLGRRTQNSGQPTHLSLPLPHTLGRGARIYLKKRPAPEYASSRYPRGPVAIRRHRKCHLRSMAARVDGPCLHLLANRRKEASWLPLSSSTCRGYIFPSQCPWRPCGQGVGCVMAAARAKGGGEQGIYPVNGCWKAVPIMNQHWTG